MSGVTWEYRMDDRVYLAAKFLAAIIAHEGLPLDIDDDARAAAENDAERALMYADALLRMHGSAK